MGAGAVFTDPDGHVLLVECAYKDGWEVPGGAGPACPLAAPRR